MDNTFGVRYATQADFEPLMAIMRGAHADNGMASMSEVKTKGALLKAINREGNILGIIDGPKGIEACILLILCQIWYSDDWHLEDGCLYVHPDHRKSTHCKNLIRFAKWCSDTMSKQAQMTIPVILGVLTKRDLEPKIRLYARELPQTGALFAWPNAPQECFQQRRLHDLYAPYKPPKPYRVA